MIGYFIEAESPNGDIENICWGLGDNSACSHLYDKEEAIRRFDQIDLTNFPDQTLRLIEEIRKPSGVSVIKTSVHDGVDDIRTKV